VNRAQTHTVDGRWRRRWASDHRLGVIWAACGTMCHAHVALVQLEGPCCLLLCMASILLLNSCSSRLKPPPPRDSPAHPNLEDPALTLSSPRSMGGVCSAPHCALHLVHC
jgi:hypothetical protein